MAPGTSWISPPPSPGATISRHTRAPQAHPHGDFTFFINGSVMAGTIHVGDRLLQDRTCVQRPPRLLELDPAKLPPDCSPSSSLPVEIAPFAVPQLTRYAFATDSGPSAIRRDRSMNSSACCAPIRSVFSSMSAPFLDPATIRSSIRIRWPSRCAMPGSSIATAGVGRLTKTEERFLKRRMAQRQFSRVRRLYADGGILKAPLKSLWRMART